MARRRDGSLRPPPRIEQLPCHPGKGRIGVGIHRVPFNRASAVDTSASDEAAGSVVKPDLFDSGCSSPRDAVGAARARPSPVECRRTLRPDGTRSLNLMDSSSFCVPCVSSAGDGGKRMTEPSDHRGTADHPLPAAPFDSHGNNR
jgi:hypothetical protein